ncbi:MAG: diaminopimelate epimerase [Halanaerobiales bacterium]|nr:diaminopimelate epimerase [Halanaerobiales bacterium]
MQVNFTKMHGLGNDFIIIDLFTQPDLNYQLYSKNWCRGHFGIGADGLVLIQPPNNQENDFKMTIYNSDGSEADMCGNAIRCFAKYVFEKNMTTDLEFRIETKAGVIIPKVYVTEGIVDQVRANMGLPRFHPEDIPVKISGEDVINKEVRFGDAFYRINAIFMGNPHCVIFTEDVTHLPVERIGPMVEIDPIFPARANVEFVEVINRNEIQMRVWERGAGLTLACGTGACASVVACVKNDLTDAKVTVHLPGGDLLIEWEEGEAVFMTGPASYAFTGQIMVEQIDKK